MRRSLITISLLLLLFSCKKNNDLVNQPDIGGRWKMVSVIDNSNGTIEIKPVIYAGDVEIELKYNASNSRTGTFSGKTITNIFGDGIFSTTADGSFTVTTFGISDAMETPWGNLFLQNIFSSTNYSIDIQGRLNIKTAAKTLVFRRI